MEFYFYNNGSRVSRSSDRDDPYGWGLWSLDQLFSYNVRFQVLTQNQGELDELRGWMLMYGRELEADVWEDWRHRRLQAMFKGPSGTYPRLLPFVFTTYDAGNTLRGL